MGNRLRPMVLSRYDRRLAFDAKPPPDDIPIVTVDYRSRTAASAPRAP